MKDVFNLDFTHRASGENESIGIVFSDLPEASRDYIIEYGLRQCLADSYASAKNGDEFRGSLNKRFDKLVAGEMHLRSVERRDPFEAECFAIAEKAIKQALREKNLVGKNAPAKEQVKKLIGEYRNGPAKDKIEKEAKRRLAVVIETDADVLGGMLPWLQAEEVGVEPAE